MTKKAEAKNEQSVQFQTSQRILDALQGIRYGSVEIIIHDGRVVQIERREKWRIEPAQ